ncbi:MAG: hypothetical protein IJY27_04290 [Clostridia bacterium]|nr:hypothetical protein [Clostridia bacterium]
MGFGILFTGYLLTFFVSLVNYGFIIRLVGYALMSIALLKLREFGKEFLYPLILALVMTVYGIYDAVYQGAGVLSIKLPQFFEATADAMTYVNLIGMTVLNFCILYAVYSITTRLELSKQRNMAIRNAIIVAVYFILNMLALGPLANNETYIKYFALPIFLIQLGWTILNAVLIFSCYMYICPEGDEDMPRRKSKIGFVEKMIEESDRRMDQAAKDTEEYMRKKQREKIERAENKASKKKKK